MRSLTGYCVINQPFDGGTLVPDPSKVLTLVRRQFKTNFAMVEVRWTIKRESESAKKPPAFYVNGGKASGCP